MKRSLLLFFIVSVWTFTARGQSEMEFISAYPEGDSLRFSVEQNWGALVPNSLQILEIEFEKKEFRNRILNKKNMFGDSEFFYRRKLTAELEDGFWYLVTSTGIFPVELIYLKGVFRLSTGGSSIEDLTLHHVVNYGYALGSAQSKEGRGRGGFVFHTDKMADFKIVSSNYTALALLDKTEMSEEERIFWRIQNQFSFEIRGETYVLVKWFADEKCFEACCQNRFSMFRKNKMLYQNVTGNSFGCDV